MTKPTAQQIREFGNITDEQLERFFEAIGTHPDHRVKSTGYVKLSWAKYGDRILDELKRRRITAGTYV